MGRHYRIWLGKKMSIGDSKLNESVEAALAEMKTQNSEMPEGCIVDESLEPCAIVIVGASGDLTARKLVPALFNLYLNDGLPDPFIIVGCSRTKMSDQDFRNKMARGLDAAGKLNKAKWKAFAKSLYYRSIDYGELSSFVQLAEALRELDKKHKTLGNKIFDLAIPPSLYGTVAQMIGRAGLSIEREDGNGWSRIVVEKPFGRDLKTAVELDEALHEHFQEHQIFRIDHYLAKETVQNVLMFRFANAIFEPI